MAATIDSKQSETNEQDEKSDPNASFMANNVRTLRLFVPGRICLFGEHSDWAASYRRLDSNIKKGRCIVCGTNQGIYANVQPHPNKLICISTNEKGAKLSTHSTDIFECHMELDELLRIAKKGETFSYVAGVAYQILLKHRVGGLVINNYQTTLPLKKGLSSSAAICVLAARAFNKIYNLKLTIEGEMDYAYLGERTTPSQCGRMDQCCAYGSRPVSMEFDQDFVNSTELQFGGNTRSSLYLVIVDLNKSKDTKTILADLNRCYGHDDSNGNGNGDQVVDVEQEKIAKNVKQLLGEINLDITQRAITAIRTGQIDVVGKLMNEAQDKFRKYAQPASPQQLSSPWLYKILAFDKIQKHIFGGKGVGSQGDGSAQLLCKTKQDQDTVCSLIEKEFGANTHGMSCIKLIIGGYQKITKCIIPTATYGATLFPSSKTISTALFPLIDAEDGLLKPAILILVEQVIKCGIEEIYIIVSAHDLASFQHLFHNDLPREQIEKLSPELQTYSELILSIGRKIKFIVQEEQLGLGHAVYCANKYIHNEDKFLLLLGDHLYKHANNEELCIQQLINYYLKTGVNCYGLQVTKQAEISHFGTVQGNWIDFNTKQALYVEKVVEKPTVEYAQKHLKIDGLNSEYLTMFGLYILNGSIMELIGNNINHKPPIRQKGVFCLTPCLQALRKEQETHGLIINGTRFDIGTSPQKYVETVYNFHHDYDSAKHTKTDHDNNSVVDKIDKLMGNL